ncbi:NAD(P)-binding protein [Imleria badia]|nr:NAD(P)-binding protein [Imleria badia]
MKVLVFGASGFIGLSVAQALSRGGHIVYGVTRSEAKAKQLAANEVFPIIGAPTDTDAWAHLIPTIDVVIEALGGTVDLRTIAVTLLNAVATTAQSTRPIGSPKVTFIYTSGGWVHGSSTDEVVSDTTPLLNPIPIVAWRPAVEQAVLKDDRVNGIVIRPSLLYGKDASLLDSVFEAAETGRQVAWYGKPGGRFSLIHADDLADVYVRAVEKAPTLGGLAIDASNDTTESVEDFLQRLIQISGAKGPHGWIEPANPFEEALATTVLVRPYLAKSLLGWQQKKPGLTDGLPQYYAAWKATHNDQPKDKLFTPRQ